MNITNFIYYGIGMNFRVARLTAEYTNTNTKLRERIEYLEAKLKKYATDLSNDSDENDAHVTELTKLM